VGKTRQRPHGAPSKDATPGGLSTFQNVPSTTSPTAPSTSPVELSAVSHAEPSATLKGELSASSTDESSATGVELLTLGSLPVGARLILRCRADWRAATVAAFEPETARVVLNVASPTGHTYRVRRPEDSPLTRDGDVPVLGEGHWRVSLARYDVRW
jgi:hypothetical protein